MMGASEILIVQIITIGVFVILPLIDILNGHFNGSNKIIWLLVVILLPGLGGIIYLIIGRKQKIKKSQ
jgi:hypothetical protein